ncbi:hypothetical protein GGR58DRAFT_28579 [Xylaria digitata]|nr:hypothetical protein GGR58DRAFT_28579 [Xylaria digitata]
MAGSFQTSYNKSDKPPAQNARRLTIISTIRDCPVSNVRGQGQEARRRQTTTRHGIPRPKVLLYGEVCPDKSDITDAFNRDLRQPIDAAFTVGTRFKIPSLM